MSAYSCPLYIPKTAKDFTTLLALTLKKDAYRYYLSIFPSFVESKTCFFVVLEFFVIIDRFVNILSAVGGVVVARIVVGKGIDVDSGAVDSVVDDEIREIFSIYGFITDAVDEDVVDEKKEVGDNVLLIVAPRCCSMFSSLTVLTMSSSKGYLTICWKAELRKAS
ncbi:hypothetical protein NDU88_000967 [Pleurodeles waltl]|uniref:Uncharacterized protein n=1 Tax=Pleurodeles waltl TaxID=8319 RepID=A0AAV7WJH6_PLEWA|nr:hypothetical protein NDU88_000967 [Pleurodeles waltl]